MGKKKMLVFVMILAVIAFGSLSVSASYSYILKSKLANNSVGIVTGNINSNITINNSTNQQFYKLTDNDGLASESFASIDINKDNEYSIFYKLTIGYTYDQNANEDTLIPLEYVKCALYDGNSLVVGPVSIGDLAIYSIDSTNITGNSFVLYTSSLAPGSQSKNLSLKVWLDQIIPYEYDEKNLSLSVSVFQETLASMSLYNFVGKVYVDDLEVSGAEVLFNHGNYSSISSGSGYSINNITIGTYPVEVKYNGNLYRTDLRVKYGSSLLDYYESVSSNFNNYQSAAFTFCSSPLRIKSNHGSIYSTNHDFGDVSIMIPDVHDLSLPEKMDVTDIPIDIYINTNTGNLRLLFGED